MTTEKIHKLEEIDKDTFRLFKLVEKDGLVSFIMMDNEEGELYLLEECL